MPPLDFLKGLRTKAANKVDKKLDDMSFGATKWWYETEAKKRGIAATFFDENNVRIRNKFGKEITAQFPTKQDNSELYEQFVREHKHESWCRVG